MVERGGKGKAAGAKPGATRAPGRLAAAALAIAEGWRRAVRFLLRWLFRAVLAFVAVSLLMVLPFRFVNPYITPYFVSERMRVGGAVRDWTPIEEFSVHVPRAVVAAEDANFCLHRGFDLEAIREALAERDERLRGASTISQQVAKNVFLWQGRSWLRKGLEAWFTLLIELTWPKRRILEVYLNVAELDDGVFGFAAAGRHYFGVEPGELTLTQAARLAAILPSPKTRSASRPDRFTQRRARQIAAGAETIAADGRAACFEGG